MGRILEMDIESFSDVDLIKCGVYAYADSPDFRVNTEGAGNVGFHYGDGSGGCRAFPF